jgi:hypothetical protein
MKTKVLLFLAALGGIVFAVAVWVFRKPAAAAAQKTALSTPADTTDLSAAGAYGIGGAVYIPSVPPVGPVEFSNEFSNEFA